MPMTPQDFGKYRLYDRLATGGMAEIYRAKMHGAAGVTKSVVVKKILPTYADNAAFVRMFINEARIAMTLAHGNVAQIFDFGEIDGEYFIAMEYVQGPALSKVLRRARERRIAVPVPIATFIAMETCKGLHYAHTRRGDDGKFLNIVHRDISPQNVIVSYEGQVKVVDFGIAKARNATSETEAGALKGKYVYFSPEQARGGELDARTDVFATGIVLYEMLTGRLPFTGKMIEVLAKITRGEFEPPSEIVDVPPALEDIVLKAMAVDPRERYQSALEFQEALGHFLYTHAPRFSGEVLGHYVSYLYEEEFQKENGRRPAPPMEFMEQIPIWQAAAPPPPPLEPQHSPTAAGRISSKNAHRISSKDILPGSDELSDEDKTDPGLVAASSLKGLALPGGIALAVTLVGIVIYGLATRKGGGGHLTVTVDPFDAVVQLDGRVLNCSTQSRGVCAMGDIGPGEHVLTVQGIGYTPMSRKLTFDPKSPASMAQTTAVQLDRIPVERPAPEPPAKRVEEEQPQPEQPLPPPQPAGGALTTVEQALKLGLNAAHGDTKNVEDYVITGVLDPRKDAIVLPHSPAAHMTLDKTHGYRVTAKGQASIGGYASVLKVSSVWYYARGPGVAKWGILGPKPPLNIAGVTDFYAFVADDNPADNSGAIVLTLTDKQKGKSDLLIVDARKNAIDLTNAPALTLRTDRANYRYTIHTEGKMDLGPGSPSNAIAYFHSAGYEWVHGKFNADEASGVVKVGGSTQPTSGFHTIWLFVFDDDPSDNSGSVTVEISSKDKVLATPK